MGTCSSSRKAWSASFWLSWCLVSELSTHKLQGKKAMPREISLSVRQPWSKFKNTFVYFWWPASQPYNFLRSQIFRWTLWSATMHLDFFCGKQCIYTYKCGFCVLVQRLNQPLLLPLSAGQPTFSIHSQITRNQRTFVSLQWPTLRPEPGLAQLAATNSRPRWHSRRA